MVQRTFLMLLLITLFSVASPGYSHAMEIFGLVFDIQGDVRLRSADGKTKSLKQSSDILSPIREGDRLEVLSGKIVVVSLRENRGYEIQALSTVEIKSNAMVALKGKFVLREGLSAPRGTARDPIGGLVLRGRKPCLKAISPVDTAVLELTPVLKWENACRGSKKVVVKILSEERVLFHAESEDASLAVPPGVLKFGAEYRWIVDNRRSAEIVGGSFSLPEKQEISAIRDACATFQGQKDNLSQRISYIFYLMNKRLNEQAKTEMAALQKEFPENLYIKSLAETGSVEGQ